VLNVKYNRPKVNEEGKELGLEPLADYLAKLNIKYQPKQK